MVSAYQFDHDITGVPDEIHCEPQHDSEIEYETEKKFPHQISNHRDSTPSEIRYEINDTRVHIFMNPLNQHKIP